MQAAARIQVEVAGRSRHGQSGAGENLADGCLPVSCNVGGVRGNAGCAQALFTVIGTDQLDGEAPDFGDGCQHAGMALFSAVTQALDPFA